MFHPNKAYVLWFPFFLFSYLRFSHPGCSYLRDVSTSFKTTGIVENTHRAVSGYATNRAVQAEKGHLPSTRSQKKACCSTVFFSPGVCVD